jgi:hypothetical protein
MMKDVMKSILIIIALVIVGSIVVATVNDDTSQCDLKYEWTLTGEYVPVWHCQTVEKDGGN